MKKDFYSYIIYDDGRVYSKHSKKFLKGEITSFGYVRITLYYDGKRKRYQLHRLIMETFCPVDNSQNLQVNHKNGDKLDNRLNNLEWVTAKENIYHAIKTGLKKPVSTKGFGQGKKTKVAMLDKNTFEKIQIFDSMSEAGRLIDKATFQGISSAIKKNSVHAGYRWKKI